MYYDNHHTYMLPSLEIVMVLFLGLQSVWVGPIPHLFQKIFFGGWLSLYVIIYASKSILWYIVDVCIFLKWIDNNMQYAGRMDVPTQSSSMVPVFFVMQTYIYNNKSVHNIWLVCNFSLVMHHRGFYIQLLTTQ